MTLERSSARLTADDPVKRKPIKPHLAAAHRLVHALHVRSYETYQPVLGQTGASEGTRDCAERWELIRGLLDEHQCDSLVDLGCSEGFYVINAARHGLAFCVGVDFDLRRLWTCQNQIILNDLPNAAFLMSAITPDLVAAMPRFDAVVFLSVLHHIMYERSLDEARAIMTGLVAKVGKVLIFEMGQSDEHLESWADKIPDMGPDPHCWVADFLRQAGFSTVDKIGEESSYAREVKRAIFKAIP